MKTVTELESASLLRSATLRGSAEEALLRTERPASLILVCANAACVGVAFAFVAARPEPMFQVFIGGATGAAFAVSMWSLGEVRRLRRRLEAVLVLSRNVA